MELQSQKTVCSIVDSERYHSFINHTWVGDIVSSCHITNQSTYMLMWKVLMSLLKAVIVVSGNQERKPLLQYKTGGWFDDREGFVPSQIPVSFLKM